MFVLLCLWRSLGLFCCSDSTKAVNDDETPEQLWGPGKGDPKLALEANGFMMRRVVLSNKQVIRSGRNGGARKGGVTTTEGAE